MKYITNVSVDEITECPSYAQTYEKTKKAKILNYLKRFKATGFTTQPVIDAFTGKKAASCDNGYTDGEYRWYESEIYYFEKYDLALKQDFIDHVLAK